MYDKPLYRLGRVIFFLPGYKVVQILLKVNENTFKGSNSSSSGLPLIK